MHKNLFLKANLNLIALLLIICKLHIHGLIKKVHQLQMLMASKIRQINKELKIKEHLLYDHSLKIEDFKII